MKFLISIFFTLMFITACGEKEEEAERKKVYIKPKSISKHKNMKDQEPPEREVIDIDEEEISVDELREIDKEIPTLELIVGKNWQQSDLDKLSGMEMLDTLRLENMDSSSFNLKFCQDLKSLKKVSFKGGTTSVETLKSLRGSPVTEIDCSGSNITDADLNAVKSAIPNAKINL